MVFDVLHRLSGKIAASSSRFSSTVSDWTISRACIAGVYTYLYSLLMVVQPPSRMKAMWWYVRRCALSIQHACASTYALMGFRGYDLWRASGRPRNT